MWSSATTSETPMRVQDALALVQVGDGQRVAAAEAGQDGFLGQPVSLSLFASPHS
jgi:hypothetical protein